MFDSYIDYSHVWSDELLQCVDTVTRQTVEGVAHRPLVWVLAITQTAETSGVVCTLLASSVGSFNLVKKYYGSEIKEHSLDLHEKLWVLFESCVSTYLYNLLIVISNEEV